MGSAGSKSGIARTVAGVVAGAGLGAFAWGSLVERRLFTLRRVSVPVLAPGSSPIRVLHLSDIHMAPWQRDKQEWIRSLAALGPDLVVNTGDNLGHVDGIAGVEYALEPFRGIPGVFVNGSNDLVGPSPSNPFKYFTGPSKRSDRTVDLLDTDRLHDLFASLGWTDLNNAAAALDLNGTHLEFYGVDDPHIGRDRLDLIAGAIDDLRADDPRSDETSPDSTGAAADRPTLTVAVTHAPYQRVLNAFVNHGAQLVFAGHTHGGQVCVPGFGALVTNCDIPRRQVKGLTRWNAGLRTAFLHVSAGLGTSIYAPVRFACPPEATMLTLTAA